MTEIAGYTYGDAELARSPVSLSELDELKAAVLFTEEDVRALRRGAELVHERIEDLFDHWFSLIGRFLLPGWAPNAGGPPIERYLHATHPRFLRWVEDTFERDYDQNWLDYQHEIGLRHHRAKKNLTDGFTEATAYVPFRWLVPLIFPMAQTIRPFLCDAGATADEAEAITAAFTKSMLLQITLWSRPYVGDADW
jgi:hypothetical protein